MILADGRVHHEIPGFEANAAIELFVAGIDPGEERRDSERLERAAHGKALIAAIGNALSALCVGDRNAEASAAFLFEFGKIARQLFRPILAGAGRKDRKNTSTDCYACPHKNARRSTISFLLAVADASMPRGVRVDKR